MIILFFCVLKHLDCFLAPAVPHCTVFVLKARGDVLLDFTAPLFDFVEDNIWYFQRDRFFFSGYGFHRNTLGGDEGFTYIALNVSTINLFELTSEENDAMPDGPLCLWSSSTEKETRPHTFRTAATRSYRDLGLMWSFSQTCFIWPMD